MNDRPDLFDTDLAARRRDRAMTLGYRGGADFLMRETAAIVAERLADIARSFPRVVLLGTGAGAVAEAVRPDGAGLVQLDPSPAMAAAAAEACPGAETRVVRGEHLDLGEAAFDLALSVLTLHQVNDPVGQLVQLRRALKPDGLMIAALFGGQTLTELRASLAEAEAEVCGGLSPRVAPMGEIRDLGGLVARAGLAMPVADVERLTVSYESPLHLMRELRAMGEGNAMTARRRQPMRRDMLARAAEIYAGHFAEPSGRVRATFEIVFLAGWAPGPDQPVPKRPGSAKARLADALGTTEISTGVKAGR
ncbi:MAG TPA: methyltransferase domain-containing protein [Thermohalobaculum sp.]|nr:methyltransferase domain-containing protein [Thermohalobaculum sp.]